VEELDLTGLKCPLPALMTARALRRLLPGAVLAVIVTDALAPLDIRFLCESEGHEFVARTDGEGATRLVLRCKG
jgi:tRNA 2-thiouridine synthesizing protein A